MSSASLLSRVWCALFAPGRLAVRLGAKPPWLDVAILLAASIGVVTWAQVSSSAGRAAVENQRQATLLELRERVSPEVYERLSATTFDAGQVAQVARSMVVTAVSSVLFSCFVFALFAQFVVNVAYQTSLPFSAVFSVVSHTAAVFVVEYLVLAALVVLTVELRPAVTISALFPLLWPDDGDYVLTFIGRIDLFVVWWFLLSGLAIEGLMGGKSAMLRYGPVLLYVGFCAVAALLSGLEIGGLTGHGRPPRA